MTETDKKIESICRLFQIRGEYRSSELITYGHINTTYKVYFFRDGEIKDYILQKVNTYVFEHPVEVMKNIISVTEHIRRRIKEKEATAKRNVLHYQKTEEGKYYVVLPDESFWRCSRFIDGSATFLNAENAALMEEAGKAYGEFQLYLDDYPVKELHIAIPHFHNTVMRYGAFRDAIAADKAGRAASVREETEKYLALEDVATEMYKMQRRGELPLRVTHNDTKCSNILFDRETHKHLAVIDLDTVMPGLIAFDFGDAIRSGANTGAEDEKELDRVAIDMEKYEAFARGFAGKVGQSLTENEKRTLALGAVTMTVECGMRFLTDYLDGDKYFRIHYPDQNLVRARCHLALAEDMLKHLDEMQSIVEKYCDGAEAPAAEG